MTIALIIGGAMFGLLETVFFIKRDGDERKLDEAGVKPGMKTFVVDPLLLPEMLLWLGILSLLFPSFGRQTEIESWGTRLMLLFTHISIYFALLLAVLPLLRRRISARACATLWTLPTLLYFYFYSRNVSMRPLLTLTLPHRYLAVLGLVWLTGFSLIVLYQVASHLLFRRALLRDAQPFTGEEALALWHREGERHGLRKEIPVLVSEEVSTPLTIGCFDHTMRLVLPKASYTDEEFFMIFRHELRHIVRGDTRTKLFLSLFTAICWFNPLSWIARRKAAEDLELSCDEAVLQGMDEEQRRRYARLLLSSAGSGRGYTTCLSGSAKSLRYRLRSVMKPAKRALGSGVIGLAMFLLFATFGMVALADTPDTLQSLVFDQVDTVPTIQSIWLHEATERSRFASRRVLAYDEEGLTDYLASLRVRRLYNNNDAMQEGSWLEITYEGTVHGEDSSLRFEVYQSGLIIRTYEEGRERTYLPEEAPDWDCLSSFMDFSAERTDWKIEPPELTICPLDEAGEAVGEPLCVVKKIKYASDTDGLWISELPNGNPEDVPGPADWAEAEHVEGLSGREVKQLKLTFSADSVPLECNAYVRKWDGSEQTRIRFNAGEDILPLADYSGHYTVCATFHLEDDTWYKIRYFFDIAQPSDAEVWQTK